MRRRDFMTLLAAAAAWPVAAGAQQGSPMPRVGVLFPGSKSDPNVDKRQATLVNALQALGWTDGQNIQIVDRRSENDIDLMQAFAKELVSLKPAAIFAVTTQVVAAIQRETRDIPIVFVAVTDPVASGFVASLAHPGGNITGFSNFEPTLAGKYIEILKEITPGTTTVAVMFNPDNIATRLNVMGPVYAAAARYHAVDIVSAPVRNDADIERVVASLGDNLAKSLVVAGEPFFGGRRIDLLNSLTTRYRVPALYSFRFFVELGGLISYGNDLVEQSRQAAGYIDRILRGANPADLPVQLPTKFEMVVNLKTAKAIGLTIPAALLARADEVIE